MGCDDIVLEMEGEEMAWISVYESINGSKLRNLHKTIGCSKFEATGILNFLWFWGLENAEPNGFLRYADREDLERYLYGEGAGCKLQMSVVVDALVRTGWIDETPEGLFLHDWSIWQEQWYKYKDRQQRNTELKREAREAKKRQLAEGADVSGDGEQIPALPEGNCGRETEGPPAPPEEPEEPKYTATFETFWNEYPRKDDKGSCYKKYQARLKDGFSADDLLRAAKNYAYICKKQHTERKYIKQGKTFLSDTLVFRDYLPAKKKDEEPVGGNPFAAHVGGS